MLKFCQYSNMCLINIRLPYNQHTLSSCLTLKYPISLFMRLGNIVLIVISLLAVLPARAQNNPINMAEHDDKQYYFGITFGTNVSEYQVHYTASFANTDTFKKIQPY